jgi:hypothetical protein
MAEFAALRTLHRPDIAQFLGRDVHDLMEEQTF